MPSKAFLKSRKEGETGQKYVAGMFRSWKLNVVETPRGYHPGYDLFVTGILHGNEVRSRVEVKYDRKAEQSGNLYLDISSLKKSVASILTICLNDPIDTVLMLPLEQALDYAVRHENVRGGEWSERSACVNKDKFIADLKPQVLKAPLPF